METRRRLAVDEEPPVFLRVTEEPAAFGFVAVAPVSIQSFAVSSVKSPLRGGVGWTIVPVADADLLVRHVKQPGRS